MDEARALAANGQWPAAEPVVCCTEAQPILLAAPTHSQRELVDA
jgi:hypothetical protein